MVTTLFPSIPTSGNTTGNLAARLPLLRDVKWDFARGRAVFANGQPVTVTGSEAVTVWAYHALQAQRYRYEHESWSYGNELFRLRGQAYRQETMEAEVKRYLTETLLACPYITSAETVTVSMDGDTLHGSVRYRDIYGGGEMIDV